MTVHSIGSAGALTWSVRNSLLRYVTVIAGGTLEINDGVTVDESGVFTFPLRSAVQDGEDRRLSFSGSVRFRAHHGFLDIRIIDPEVIIGPAGGVVVARTDDTEAIIPIASAGPVVPTVDGTDLDWSAVPTRLLDTAVALFGDVYPTGTEMAPFSATVTLDS